MAPGIFGRVLSHHWRSIPPKFNTTKGPWKFQILMSLFWEIIWLPKGQKNSANKWLLEMLGGHFGRNLLLVVKLFQDLPLAF